MIVVEVKLLSANGPSRDADLGTLLIANSGDLSLRNPKRGDYEARMYRKGDLARLGSGWRLWSHGKPSRRAEVLNHARLAEPVHNLVAKALAGMGYS